MSTSQILKRATSASMRSPVRRSFHDTDRRPAILMPAMSPFMTDGTITRWIKKEGDAFEVGEVLLQIESDIAVVDVQATHPGILGKILSPEGSTNVPVSKVIALVNVATSKELSSPVKETPRPMSYRHVRTSSFMSTPSPISTSTPPAPSLHTSATRSPVATATSLYPPPSPAPKHVHTHHTRSVSMSSSLTSEYARAGLDMRKQVVANLRSRAVKDCFDEVL